MNADNPSWYKIEKKRAQLALLPAIVWVVLIWLAFIVDYTGLFAWDFSRLGILPGVADGLIGIIFSPFIHSSFSHLLSNTLPC
jgi:membrane associated rhomboid family serine protease